MSLRPLSVFLLLFLFSELTFSEDRFKDFLRIERANNEHNSARKSAYAQWKREKDEWELKRTHARNSYQKERENREHITHEDYLVYLKSRKREERQLLEAKGEYLQGKDLARSKQKREEKEFLSVDEFGLSNQGRPRFAFSNRALYGGSGSRKRALHTGGDSSDSGGRDSGSRDYGGGSAPSYDAPSHFGSDEFSDLNATAPPPPPPPLPYEPPEDFSQPFFEEPIPPPPMDFDEPF